MMSYGSCHSAAGTSAALGPLCATSISISGSSQAPRIASASSPGGSRCGPCGIHLKNAPRVQAKVHHLSPVEKCTTSNELPVARRCRKELGGGYLGSVATGQASGSAWVVGAPDRAGAGAEPANGDPRLAGGSAPAVSPGVDDFPAGFLAGQAGSGAPP